MNALALEITAVLLGIQGALSQSPPTQDPASRDPAAEARAPMPVPVTVACRRADRPIEVDGSLVDWPELPAVAIDDVRQLSGTADGAWRGPADLSAFAFLLWDEEDLYFAATVRDEWHRALDPKSIMLAETPIADSIVLSFDPLRNTRSLGPDPGRREDTEFWLSEEPSHEVMRWDRLRGAARVLETGRVVVSHDLQAGITTYELKVPWSEILLPGHKATAGTVLDMQVVVNDFDESTDPMPQTRIGWTFGCGVTADPCLFGSVMLIDDSGELRAGMPQVPERPAAAADPRLEPRFWSELADGLQRHPAAVHDGSAAPGEAGGIGRLELLERLDYEIGRYPRVDYVEYCQRVNRRMVREVAAAEQRGLPLFWAMRSRPLAATIDKAAEPGTVRLSRLPQNGWLVRGPRQAFLVDPAGSDAATLMWGAADFALIPEPLDMTRRNDQLLLRMADAKPPRPCFSHIAFHLPRLLMADMPLIEPHSSSLQPDGARVTALGDKRADGNVLYAMGYRVELPGPIAILFAGPAMRVEDVPAGRCDALVLTPRNSAAVAIARAVAPDLVVVDDAFLCFQLPNVARVDLHAAHALQSAVLPLRSVLLAPGETWEIVRRQ